MGRMSRSYSSPLSESIIQRQTGVNPNGGCFSCAHTSDSQGQLGQHENRQSHGTHQGGHEGNREHSEVNLYPVCKGLRTSVSSLLISRLLRRGLFKL